MRQTKACGSRVTTLTMVFKLATQAERHWRRNLVSCWMRKGAIFGQKEKRTRSIPVRLFPSRNG